MQRVTSSMKTHLDTSLDGIMSRITSLESKCDSIVELIQGLHKSCDGQGVGIVNFNGVNEMQEQYVPILKDEVKFETSSQICAKLQSEEIDLSTPPDDLLSRKNKAVRNANLYRQYGWGELSFDETISSLKSSLKPTKTTVGSSYQLVGFPYAFMLLALLVLLVLNEDQDPGASLVIVCQGHTNCVVLDSDSSLSLPFHGHDKLFFNTYASAFEKKKQNAEGHSDEKEEATEERVTGLGPLNMEEMRRAKNQEKNVGTENLLPFPLIKEFSKSSLYSELQDFGGTEVDEDNINKTKNCGDVDSIINNVISSVFAASSSLPISLNVKNTQAERSELGGINNDTTDVISDVDATTKFVNVDSTTCVVEIFHDEQKSTHVSPMKNKVSPLKPKGSPMKKRTYIRKKKGSKAAISDVASELNSMSSSVEAEVKDTTPKKSVGQKFL
ncbi:hypothetical protein BC332_28380 [Capsicum chinense]|nr:hypothetical protein BC332_28380 [Capsicum chinense]